MNGKWKWIKCSLCESPVFERGYNWRAQQKGRNDKGELVGLSSLLIWFWDRLVWQSGKHRERKANTWCDGSTHRHTGKIRPAGGVQASSSAWSFHAKSSIFRQSVNKIQASIFFIFVRLSWCEPSRVNLCITGCLYCSQAVKQSEWIAL